MEKISREPVNHAGKKLKYKSASINDELSDFDFLIDRQDFNLSKDLP